MLECYYQQYCWKCTVETVLCAGDENSDDGDDVDVDDEMNGEDIVDSDMSEDECHQQDSLMTD